MSRIPTFVLLFVFGLLRAFAQPNSLTLSFTNGLTLISNPFDHGSNTVAELFTNVPEGTMLYTFDAPNQRWYVNQFEFGAWVQPTQVLPAGDGAFVRNPTNTFSITFTGTPPASVSPTIYPGYNVVSALPTPEFFDEVYVWDSSSQQYQQPTGWFGVWSPATPVLLLGSAVIYQRGESSATNGTVYFNNYVPASGINAYIWSTLGCLGTNLVAQLFYGPLGTSSRYYLPVGEPVRVLPSEAGVGYIVPTGDLVRMLPSSGSWDFQVRFWDQRYGYFNGANASRSGVFWAYASDFPGALRGWGPSLIGPIAVFWVDKDDWSRKYVFVGTDADFHLTSGYEFGFTFQWQRKNESNVWVDIVGATSNRLEFHPAKLSDTGVYRLTANLDSCVCTNPSLPVTLNVLPLPIIESAAMVSNNQLLVTGSATTNLSYEIDYSSNLLQWAHLTTLTNAPLLWSFTDTNTFLDVPRFYRARVLQ